MKKEFKISYTYDPLNRLSTVALNGKAGKRYDYDPAGNLIAISTNIPASSKETVAVTEPPAGKESEANIRTVAGREPVAVKEPAARDERYATLEEEYNRLNDLAQAGSLSLEQFQEEVNRLRFQDAGGTWWQLRFDGTWLRWDGTAWIEA